MGAKIGKIFSRKTRRLALKIFCVNLREKHSVFHAFNFHSGIFTNPVFLYFCGLFETRDAQESKSA